MEMAKPGGTDEELDGEYSDADDGGRCWGELSEQLPAVSVKDEAEDDGLDEIVS